MPKAGAVGKAAAEASAQAAAKAGAEAAALANDRAKRAASSPPQEAHLEEVPIPAKRLKATEDVAPQQVQNGDLAPAVPPPTALVDAWPVIRSIIPWVEAALVKLPLVAGGAQGAASGAGGPAGEAAGAGPAGEAARPGHILRGVPPLDIKGDLREDEMASYQAPWRSDQCLAALRSTHMYQAGGNLLWVTAGPGSLCPAGKVSWAQVREIQATFFDTGSRKAKLTKSGRIVFPMVLQVYIQEMGFLACATTAGGTCFPLLGGHGVVMAWWAAMYDALRAGEAATGQIAALWQCALSTTIQLRYEPEPRRIMSLSILASENLAASAKHLTDNFLVFADKLKATGVPLDHSNLQTFKELGMRYNGSPINKTMLQTASLVQSRLSTESREILTEIEFAHGRDVLTSGYNKLMRLIQVAEKVGEGVAGGPSEAVRFVLEAVHRLLAMNPQSAKGLTIEALDSKKDGGAGLVPVILGRKWVRDLCGDLVADLSKLDKPPAVAQEFERVLGWFADYTAFNAAFPLPRSKVRAGEAAPGNAAAGAAAAEDDDDDDGDEGRDDGEDAISAKKQGLSKHGGQLLELCYALYSGLGDKDLANTMKDGSVPSLSKLTEDGGGFIGSHFRELKTSMASHRKIIAVDATAAPPPPASRTLKRYATEASDAGDGADQQIAAERTECWRSAQALRRKHSAVATWSYDSGMAGLTKILARPGPVADFRGKQKEAHRAFVFSADLLAETVAEPWRDLSDNALEGPIAATLIDWMLQQKGPFDILIFCDGRSRKARRVVEDALIDRAHVVENWLIFGGSSGRVCPGRNVSFGAMNREVILIAFPCARTSLSVKERGAFNACGEASTHWATYTGVTGLPLKSMAKVTPADKHAIMGTTATPAKPPDRLADSLSDSVPLFWQERKPGKWWLQVLRDLDVRCVVDVTPGSGVLAQACLHEGLPYLGITRNKSHSAFMQNRLDRDALGVIARSSSVLYEADLAEQLKAHFADIIEETAGDEAAVGEEDTDMEDDEAMTT